MFQVQIAVSMILFGLASAGPQYYRYPVEHRSITALRGSPAIAGLAPNVLYDYQIVPSDQYTLVEVPSESELSVWDFIPSPLSIVGAVASKLASTALCLGKLILAKGVFILVGAGLVIGFCALTPFCTLTIEKPFFGRHSRAIVPYLDEIENFFTNSYEKYYKLNETSKMD